MSALVQGKSGVGELLICRDCLVTVCRFGHRRAKLPPILDDRNSATRRERSWVLNIGLPNAPAGGGSRFAACGVRPLSLLVLRGVHLARRRTPLSFLGQRAPQNPVRDRLHRDSCFPAAKQTWRENHREIGHREGRKMLTPTPPTESSKIPSPLLHSGTALWA